MSKLTRAAKPKMERTIREFINLYNSKKIKLDLSFQRQACWKESSKRNFIEGLLKGDFLGAFLLAKIPNHQRDSYETYFDELQAEGFEYVSIDGNNRTVTISEFLDNKFAVNPPNSNSLVLYKDLDDKDKGKFDDKENPILIVEYTGISQAECSEIFINHNESEKLRHQELRNARLYPISSYVRELEEKHRPKILPFDPANTYRTNDEFILDFICYQEDYTSITNKKRRDSVWQFSSDKLNLNTKYLEKSLKLAVQWLKECNGGRKTVKAVLRDFAIIRGILNNKGYGEIAPTEEANFIKKLAQARTSLYRSTGYITLDDSERTMMSYAMIAGRPVDQYAFKARIEELSKVVKNVIKANDFKFTTPRSKSTQDVEIRHSLWKFQNMLCVVTGEVILDFLDGDKWHVDHIVPLREGGLDDITNMRLINAKENLKKGSKAA